MGSRRRYEALSGGIFLIGLGILFLVRGASFFPWILVVIGLAGLPASLSREKGWAGWRGFLWMVGLALLFWSGHFFPGILILVGVSALIGALTRGSEGSPFAGPSNEPRKNEAFVFAEKPSDEDQVWGEGEVQNGKTRKLADR